MYQIAKYYVVSMNCSSNSLVFVIYVLCNKVVNTVFDEFLNYIWTDYVYIYIAFLFYECYKKWLCRICIM